MTFEEHLAEQMQDPEFKAEWEAHEECYQDVRRLTEYIIRLQKLARELYWLTYEETAHLGNMDRLVELANEHEWLTEREGQETEETDAGDCNG